MARPLHCLSATPGCVTPPGWALPTQYPVQLTSTVYTHTVYVELHVRRQAGSEGREGERENRRWEGRMEQGAGGREEAMM